MGRRRGWSLVGAGALALALAALTPGFSAAAEVSVTETSPYPRLRFEAGPGEANELTVVYGAGDPGHFAVDLTDGGAAVSAGAGCSGGGATGVQVECLVHRYHALETYPCGRDCVAPVPNSAWYPRLSISLGDGGSSFEAPEAPPAGEPPLPMYVAGGSGGDLIVTGNGDDAITPGSGVDAVHAGGGSDEVIAPAQPDGPDLYDLGAGFGRADYSARTTPIELIEGSPALAGAPGEGDELPGLNALRGGSGDDVLFAGAAVNRLEGGPGNDLLSGGAGDDHLEGGTGADRYMAGEGNDYINDIVGPDPGVFEATDPSFADGGPGDDTILLGDGPDEALGGPGNDLIRSAAGDDVDRGEAGDDQIAAGEGDDLVEGGEGNDALRGNGGGDSLFGGAGKDRVDAASVIPEPFDLPIDGLRSRGAPVDGLADRVGCGAGADVASINPWDAVRGCERQLPVRAVELGRRYRRLSDGTVTIQVGVSSPGQLTVSGPAVRQVNRSISESAAINPARGAQSGVWLRLRLRGKGLERLRRSGRARIAVVFRFQPRGGIARSRHARLIFVER